MFRLVSLLLVVSGLCAQQMPFDRLRREVAHAQGLTTMKDGKWAPATQVAGVHQALLNWIESRLPVDKATMPSLSRLEASMQRDLQEAGLTEARDVSDTAMLETIPGDVHLEIKSLPELPNALLVKAGVGIPCGQDEAFYLYQFDTSRTRIVTDHPKSSFGFSATAQISQPDQEGRRVLLIHRMSVQCSSTWMGLAYSAYRIRILPGMPEKLLSEEHGFWLGNDGPEYALRPDGLVVEFLDHSVDAVVHNRTRVFRYSFAPLAHRVEPIALQPQDFVEEWLEQPWEAMQSWSAPETSQAHATLHADYVAGLYSTVVPCVNRPGRWLIELDISRVGEKEFPQPLETYFLVRELGPYQYRMESVGDARPKGCPGDVRSLEKHPWPATAEVWAIH